MATPTDAENADVVAVSALGASEATSSTEFPDEPVRPPLTVAQRVTRWAFALIVLQTIFRAWLGFRGWFVADDFQFIARSATQRFWSYDYLLKPYNGHLMPGGFAFVKLTTTLWPFNFTPVVLVDIAVQAITSAVVFLLLRSLFSPRMAILVPLAIYLFSPLTLPAFLWWAVAIGQLPEQLAIATALLMHISYLRTGKRSRGLLGVLAVVGGLLFYEKTILIVPFIAAMTILFSRAGGLWRVSGGRQYGTGPSGWPTSLSASAMPRSTWPPFHRLARQVHPSTASSTSAPTS